MAYQLVPCKYCNSSGRTRFKCKACGRIFKTDYVYRAYDPGVKEQVVDMALNGSGIRDTARVLGIGKGTVSHDTVIGLFLNRYCFMCHKSF